MAGQAGRNGMDREPYSTPRSRSLRASSATPNWAWATAICRCVTSDSAESRREERRSN